MTQPALAKKSRGDGPRVYAWPPAPATPEFEVISVTSACGMMPMPWLTPWAVKVTAQTAIDKYELLGTLIEDSPKAAESWLKESRFRNAGDKGDRGTIVHAALESYVGGSELTTKQIDEMLQARRVDRKLWKSTHLMVKGVLGWLFDAEPEIHWSETTVFSREHGYAGTPDVMCNMNVLGENRAVVLDIKTSNGIHDEVVLQTAAYGRSDFVGTTDGVEHPTHPRGEAYDFGVIVNPTPSGKVNHAYYEHTPEAYEQFLAMLHFAKTQNNFQGCRRI